MTYEEYCKHQVDIYKRLSMTQPPLSRSQAQTVTLSMAFLLGMALMPYRRKFSKPREYGREELRRIVRMIAENGHIRRMK